MYQCSLETMCITVYYLVPCDSGAWLHSSLVSVEGSVFHRSVKSWQKQDEALTICMGSDTKDAIFFLSVGSCADSCDWKIQMQACSALMFPHWLTSVCVLFYLWLPQQQKYIPWQAQRWPGVLLQPFFYFYFLAHRKMVPKEIFNHGSCRDQGERK